MLAGPLPARTPRTLTTPIAVARELAAVPDRGWAVDREEGNIGVSCVAAPIFGPLGDVVAALSVTGPSQLVRADRHRARGAAGGRRGVPGVHRRAAEAPALSRSR